MVDGCSRLQLFLKIAVPLARPAIITSTIFCGYGFGLYGQLSRAELLWVVVGVWAFILLWSKPWLDRFHYGPFEWAWRSLVQWKPQRFVRS